MKIITYRELNKSDLNEALFENFNRYQAVKKCWHKENGEWILKDNAYTEQWGPNEYKYLLKCLHNTVETGGSVFGAFSENMLIGFASVENKLFGSRNEYLQLSSIHTSYEYRGRGIGKKLFSLICARARELGAKKLYISAHSSQETQAYYRAMGCLEATQCNAELLSGEPYDVQLEYSLA